MIDLLFCQTSGTHQGFVDIIGSDTSTDSIITGGETNDDDECKLEKTDFRTLDEDHGNTQSDVPRTATTLGSDLNFDDYIREQDYVSEWEAYEASRM